MSSKKRKAQTDASRAATPVSAISARRRLLGAPEPDGEEEDDGLEPVTHRLTPSNAFSALQGLRRSGNPSQNSPSPAKQVLPAARTAKAANGVSSPATSEQHVSLAPSSPQTVQYSSFVLNARNHKPLEDNGIELRLEDGERFVVVGMFGIQVLAGHVTIAGAVLRAGDAPYWVAAPTIHAVPVIRTHEETRLCLLQDDSLAGLRCLGSLSPLFAQIWHVRKDEPALGGSKEPSFQILFSSEDISRKGLVQELISPPIWNKKLASLVQTVDKDSTASFVVCGPKSAGKSTFSKTFVNRLVTRQNRQTTGMTVPAVALLDLDPGQPEYGPPGTLSLVRVDRPNLGVPFTHPGRGDASATVVCSHALAAVSPASNPRLYRECALALHQVYSEQLSHLPLVVNTPGWIQGTGLELLTDIISHIDPSEVLYMSEEGPAESVVAIQAATKHIFSPLPSQPSEFTARTAAELREMQTMSYFHLNSELRHGRLHWSADCLTHSRPWVIPYTSSKALMGIVLYDHQVPPELLADSMNGAVLAVLGIKSVGALPRCFLPDAVQKSPELIPHLPNPEDLTLTPSNSQLIGLILIRGIDTEKKCLQVCGPTLDIDRLRSSEAIMLVHGQFGSPNWAYTEHLYQQQNKEDPSLRGSRTNEPPWVEILKGNQSRPIGSRRWRVRRDLGRAT